MSRMPDLGRGLRVVCDVMLLMRAAIAGTALVVQRAMKVHETGRGAPGLGANHGVSFPAACYGMHTSCQAAAGGPRVPLLREAGKVARRAGRGVEGENGSMRRAAQQRATPHSALHAQQSRGGGFAVKLEGKRRGAECENGSTQSRQRSRSPRWLTAAGHSPSGAPSRLPQRGAGKGEPPDCARQVFLPVGFRDCPPLPIDFL